MYKWLHPNFGKKNSIFVFPEMQLFLSILTTQYNKNGMESGNLTKTRFRWLKWNYQNLEDWIEFWANINDLSYNLAK
jgi:hypothetical protein